MLCGVMDRGTVPHRNLKLVMVVERGLNGRQAQVTYSLLCRNIPVKVSTFRYLWQQPIQVAAEWLNSDVV
jgi:hypothetical protein